MLLRILLTVVIVYAVLLLMLYLFQPRLVFLPGLPGRALTATPDLVDLEFEEVYFETADGETLHGWWLPHERPRATVLFHHGNAGNISHRLDTLRIFHDLGVNVLIYDYRGYGRSSGSPSEEGLYLDARAAWDWLTETRGIVSEKIILFGRSLGGAVASELATQVPAGGLIVESTFTSVPDIGAELYWWLPVRMLSRMNFNAAANMAQVRMPVLIVHSVEDEIIPFSHGERLRQAAAEDGTLLEIRGDHNTGFLASGERYRNGLDQFLGDIAD